MPRILLVPVLVAMLAVPAAAAERRCGWLQNPTPANLWLTDPDGTWIIAMQGGPPAPGADKLDQLPEAQFVKTNGPYGYRCACLSATYDKAAQRVTVISAVEPLALDSCRRDPRLPDP